MANFDSVYLVYLFVGLSAALLAEGVYLLFFTRSSYRKNINRRLKISDEKTDQQSILIQLRRERGLTASGEYRLPLINLNQLMVQSGLTLGWSRLLLIALFTGFAVFGGMLVFHWPMNHARPAGVTA